MPPPSYVLARIGPAAAFSAALAAALAPANASFSGERGPSTSFTPGQAVAGAHEYAEHCARCHGTNLEGALGSPLRGESFTTLGTQSGLSIGSFFRFMITETPVGAGGSLSNRQYVEILAFVLHENGYRAGTRALTFEAALRSEARIAVQPAPAAGR